MIHRSLADIKEYARETYLDDRFPQYYRPNVYKQVFQIIEKYSPSEPVNGKDISDEQLDDFLEAGLHLCCIAPHLLKKIYKNQQGEIIPYLSVNEHSFVAFIYQS